MAVISAQILPALHSLIHYNPVIWRSLCRIKHASELIDNNKGRGKPLAIHPIAWRTTHSGSTNIYPELLTVRFIRDEMIERAAQPVSNSLSCIPAWTNINLHCILKNFGIIYKQNLHRKCVRKTVALAVNTEDCDKLIST